MAGTKDRKLYVAALGVALAGFALDRVFFSGDGLGPSIAEAAPTAPQVPGAIQAAMTTAEEPRGSAQIAARLRALEAERQIDPTRVRNAFWLEGVSVTGPAGDAGDADESIRRFHKLHKLRAVVSGPAGDFILVGNERLEVGDVLDGFRLIEIQAKPVRRAVFDFDGRNVELSMDSVNLTGTGGSAQAPDSSGR